MLRKIIQVAAIDVLAILAQVALVLANGKFGWHLSLPVLVLPGIVYAVAVVVVASNVRGLRVKLLGR
jgi:hypothetical protein